MDTSPVDDRISISALPNGGGELVYETDFDPAETSVCWVVVDALATVTETDPCDLDVRLDDVIDVGALDDLFGDRADGRTRVGGVVSFAVDDVTVVVDAEYDRVELHR